jgi:hypothetical protein
VKCFHELKGCDVTPSVLQEEMGARGYVLIRGLLPRETVDSVLFDVTQVLSVADWLLPGYDSKERMANVAAACGDPDPKFKRVYQEVFNLESFHALPHQASLREVMTMFAGNQPIVHPKPIGRLIFPRCERLVTHAHQDLLFGSPCMTVLSKSDLCGFLKGHTALGSRSMNGRTSRFRRFQKGPC